MSVSARFYVQRVTRFAHPTLTGQAVSEHVEVVLYPVSGAKGDHNKGWASATPAGEIKLTVGNFAAATWFAEMLGKDVAITFEERPEEG